LRSQLARARPSEARFGGIGRQDAITLLIMESGGLLSHPSIRIRTANDKSYNESSRYSDLLQSLPPLNAAARQLRILLLEPLYPADVAWGSAKVEQGYLPPIGLISIYTFLKYRGYAVDFVDTQFGDHDEESVRSLLKKGQYDVVGIPVFTSTADYCFATAHLIREVLPLATIVFGNIHASSQPELTFRQCPVINYIIKHEGEFTFDELLRCLADRNDAALKNIMGLARMENGIFIEHPNRPFIEDLDALPIGVYSDLDLKRYVPHPTQYIVLPNVPVVTQRGCPYPCTYCEASVILGKKTRTFSQERIIEELKILRDKKGARGIYFQDSTFTMNKKYVMKLFELMIRENLGLLWSCNTRSDRVDDELCDAMYKAGCRQIILGIESGNQRSLDVIRKQTTVETQTRGVKTIHRHKIESICSYILCLPGETEELAMNTVAYAKSLASRIAMFYLPVPYPGSALYQACAEDGGLRKTGQWSDFLAVDFRNPVYVNPLIGKEKMQEIYQRAFRLYYSHPPVWWANARSIFRGLPASSAMRGFNALSAMVGLNPLSMIKSMYRGFHGQTAPYHPLN
jgi:radical SAM superfamily enzyme YgiQ (UPF0313 family)